MMTTKTMIRSFSLHFLLYSLLKIMMMTIMMTMTTTSSLRFLPLCHYLYGGGYYCKQPFFCSFFYLTDVRIMKIQIISYGAKTYFHFLTYYESLCLRRLMLLMVRCLCVCWCVSWFGRYKIDQSTIPDLNLWWCRACKSFYLSDVRSTSRCCGISALMHR